jgi:polyketide synthase PksN
MEKRQFEVIIEKFREGEISRDEAKRLLNALKTQKDSSSYSPRQQDRIKTTEETAIRSKSAEIAVIGISGQFPDAVNIEILWQNLNQGHDAIHELPAHYFDQSQNMNSKKEMNLRGGILAERDCFDPLFFNISPREAESMNPHQRLVLQESWKALEDAGYNPKKLADSQVGIFIGAEPTGYFYESFTGSSDAIIASRLSYFLNLKGPAIVVNTGCSSSGVAIHLACESLRNGESMVAIAGGVNAYLNQSDIALLLDIGMLSPTGRCCTFDETANGTVLSEGIGIVVLKRLGDAISAGDHIYGVIRGTGINQDGASNGITAPNGMAQEQLISNVYQQFEINPEEISYIETHGTGTKLGDPVEVNALVRAFKQFTMKEHYCVIGSVKTHIGHAAAASGVIGLIKVLLSLQHHKIQGLINFKKLNPLIEIEGSAFYINTSPVEWRSKNGKPLMAALNSFGHSGTNVHLVVQEYISPDEMFLKNESDVSYEGPVLIPISAKNKAQLKEYLHNLLEYIKNSNSDQMESISNQPISQETSNVLAGRIRSILAEILQVKEDEIEVGERFQEYGVEQVHGMQLLEKLQVELGIEIESQEFITRNSISEVTEYLMEQHLEALKVRNLIPQNIGKPAKEIKISDDKQDSRINPTALAYTLQIGREPMEERIVFLINDIPELITKLEAALADTGEIANCWHGQVKQGQNTVRLFATDEDMQEAVEKWFTKGKLRKIGELWSQGFVFDWNKLYGEIKPRRIGLPTYPFAKERYWLPVRAYHDTPQRAPIHPLLQQNTSDLSEQRYSSTFTGQEFFLADHMASGRRILPGVASLEMARAAVEQAVRAEEGQAGIRLKDVVWVRPIVISEEPVQVHIGIYPEDNNEIVYEIYGETEEDDGPVIYSRGKAMLTTAAENPVLDLKLIQAECNGRKLSGTEVYSVYKSNGFDCDPKYQGIEAVYIGQGRVLAKLALPSSVTGNGDEFVLHPGIMDAVLQVSIVMEAWAQERMVAPKPFSPVTLQELEVSNSCTGISWAMLQYHKDNTAGDQRIRKLDIDLCDEQGRIGVRLKGLEIQAEMETDLQNIAVSKDQEPYELMTFEEVWQEQVLPELSPVKLKTIVCFLSNPDKQQEMIDTLTTFDQQTKIIFVSQSTIFQKQTQEKYNISRADRNTYVEAFQSIREDYGAIETVFYLWALEDAGCIKDYSCFVYILQALAAANLRTKRVLLAANFENDSLERCYLESWIGFERSLGMILPNTQIAAIYQVTERNQGIEMKDWARKLRAELQVPKVQSVLYQGGKRYLYQIRPIPLPSAETPVRAGGTYLITGGGGGLGFLFAEYIAQKHPVNLVLIGRSAIDTEKQMKIKVLEELGSRAMYLPIDVCNSNAMKAGLNQVKERFGRITGVIHAAGIQGAQDIFKKDYEDFQKIIAPKINGTQVLDQVLKEEPLDFICYFSSSAAILGDFGSCDYAVGNRFQMAYANYRNRQTSQGLAKGKAVVINWPLWREGGMGFGNAENTKIYLKTSGQRILETAEGVGILDQILGQNGVQYLIIAGQPSRVYRFLGLTEERPTAPLIINSSSSDKRRRIVEMKGLSVEQCLEWDLKEQISNLVKISRDKIERDENLADFGFDSISLAQLAGLLTNHYGIEITPAIFFGYSTLGKLTQYFLQEHQETIHQFYREEDEKQFFPTNIPTLQPPRIKRTRFSKNRSQNLTEPIAIIGMSGRFPGARNIDELWTILATGADMVKEIPKERFDWRQYYGGPNNEPGKINCKWCGCIPGISEFDPLFFEISPREAESMDPRQRLLLEESWKALEDAGYGAKAITTQKIGMFVGVEQGDYQLLTKTEGSITSNHNAILASRLAYFLNLNGPVMAINTACSSGLVAAHQGILSLYNGECDAAIIAGVNLIFTPDSFIGMSQAGMLSGDGKCYAFDKRANGMVPGEAVAVLVCKRLSQAEADGDPIYAVIRGSGLNYDGKTNGITAPSGVSQTALLKAVYDQFQINPEGIEYIITHGTGTRLGDPVEINALYNAFKDYTKKERYCALTSTKTNFGHTFAASGLVSLISLVQALLHEMIPASLHCEQENDYINWKASPFFVNKTNKPWPGGKTRIGGVSAFGMSGTNAHMIVESYSRTEVGLCEGQPFYLLALSAKTRETLLEKVKDLIKGLENETIGDLLRISYTLLEGRQHFNHRCAIVVQEREDAIHVLKQVESAEKIPGLFQGKVPRDFTGQKAIEQYAQDLLKQCRTLKENKSKYQEILFALADLYCQGYEMDWNSLFGGDKPGRVNLPTYPFAREHYWVPGTNTKGSGVTDTATSTGITTYIHPLLQQNTSDLSEQRYRSTFTGREFFLADHVVRSKKVLPGVAYLEMARAAVEMAAGNPAEDRQALKLKNVVWARPIGVDEEPVQVFIGLYPEDNGEIAYEIYSPADSDEAEAVVYSQGSAILAENTENPVLNLQALQAECNERKLLGAEIYNIFKAIGLDYGPGFQGIETVYTGQGRVLAKLSLPSSVAGTEKEFMLHPSIMDAALQASIGMEAGGPEAPKLSLPFALHELEVYNRCTGSMWAILQYSKDNTATDKVRKLDIDLCDEQGQVCVRLKGFSSRVLEGGIAETGPVATIGSLMFEPVWKEQSVTNIDEQAKVPEFAQQLVILCEPEEITPESIESGLNGVNCLRLQSKQKSIAKRFEVYACQVLEAIQKILADKPTDKVLIRLVVTNRKEQQLFAGLSGILKTAQIENPKVIWQLIEFEATEEPEGLIAKLKENSNRPLDNRIRYQGCQRQVAGWSEVTVAPETAGIPWKDGGVYLITGGAGGLGMIFAKEIVTRVKGVTLVLTGRSSFDENKQASLKELELNGAKVEYRSVDVSVRNAVYELIQSIGADFGKLDGIIHSAGIIRDNYIIKKSKEELLEVLAPKVTGLENLDVASKDLNLDFMILFSSTAGSLGNPGQADYATANAFMDAYAGYRNLLVSSGQRQGRTLSINWPLWQEGGMRVDETVENIMQQSTGMVALRTKTGIRTLYDGIASGRTQVMVMEGDIRQIRAVFSKQSVPGESMNTNSSQVKPETVTVVAQDLLQEKTSNYLKKLLSPVIKLPAERIEADIPLEKYGIDSIMVMQLTNQLEKTFGSLSKTLFFEYQTIRELANYFLDSYRDRLLESIGIEETAVTALDTPLKPVIPVIHNRHRSRFVSSENLSLKGKNITPLDIAIIGISGRYPQARNLNEFWHNLRDGKDCITEIPKERWDHSLFFDEDKDKVGKTYTKWGGFLEGVDQFDPLFFNISPREAEIMDPQERLFLECVYETLQDAGYTRETLSKYKGLELEGNVGVYVGVMYEEYQLYGAEAQVQGHAIALSGNPSSIANRVSYFCNFHGPSVALDTMCSSSLTAIHMACQSIRRGECELAIAGGVNVSIHPNKYLMLGQGKFASSKGRCESFGIGGDGYVPGEGVGAVLLKPLSKAIADSDQIYGVIKGIAINHGGKTNGYSVPNPNAQAGAIGQALREAGIDPRTISYIEAHGTGTSLGDPIEITGLVKAFQKYTENKQFCAIGSAKSNIGHCESAAGIAGLTKVLLQLKNRQIVPSLHSEVLNPNIDFSNTPFVVQQELTEWERPVVMIDGISKEYPRIAGISSFGAGGSNVHIVIEEYIPRNQEQPAITVAPQNPSIIVLSAKSEEQLKEQAKQLLTAIKEQQLTDGSLADMAYTLQVGREAMEERLAVVVSSLQELEEKLGIFLNGQDGIEDLYQGKVKRDDHLAILAVDEEMQEAIQKWIQRKKYGKLLALWVKGLVFDFNRLYGENKPRRISLPTYPFARERYWVPEFDLKSGEVKPVIPIITKPPKTEKVILIKDWRPKEIKTKPDMTTGVILVLGTAKTTKLALSLFQDTEGVKVIPVIHGESDLAGGIATDFYSVSHGEALYRQVNEKLQGATLTGVIDLTAYDDIYEQSTALEAGKLIFLQKLIENDRQQGYYLMQITYRLNSFEITKTTMQGARLAGLYRMLGAEYQQIKTLTMDTDCHLNFYKKAVKQIETEFGNRKPENYSECCYRNDIRYEPILKIAQTDPEIQESYLIPVKYQPEEVILITGGSRGIGAAVAGHIVSQGVKNLIIMGREELPEQSEWKTIIGKQENPELTAKLKRLHSYIERGVKVRYYSTSLSDEEAIRALVEQIHQEFGPITGVFHCAGVVSKIPVFFEKPLNDIETICGPKMNGLVAFHQALAQEPLRFFILFSSISSIVPTLAVGQIDYAMANAYMDYYATYQVSQGKTYLKSVQWPAWGETGMAAGGMNTPAYLNSGLVSHSTADGLMLLDVIKKGDNTVSAPCVMMPDKFILNQLLQTKLIPLNKEPDFRAKQALTLKTADATQESRSLIQRWLKDIFVSKLKLTNNQLDINKTFDEYGVDSIILAQLVRTMQERITQTLDPSLLLQYQTLDKLIEYFATHHGEAFGVLDESQREIAAELSVEKEENITLAQSFEPAKMGAKSDYSDIAIIGIACRFPGSPDKNAYWDLLTKGKNAIKQVPKERWSRRENRMDYGGWIDGIDLFDAKFFNINEKDAAVMDPQARVILEESLKAIYDAGYEHKQLSGKKIGVYIGGRLQPTSDMATIFQAPNPILGLGQNYMATNISRFFNFTGPSMVIDTACSSGLTGMSLAAEALQGRRIDMALAGAVNLLLNPNAFEMFAARNILSKNGEFHIFEKQSGSGGEVLGEGVGVVVLKRLDDAIRDGNRIYGVIKAIAINNDGRTIGPGSPNLNAQTQVMKEALAISGKSVAEIGYIEVNGGGSPVVDAIEIKSLAEAYRLDNQNLGPCYLGSIKPNIGHLLLTSGMAGLIRCVLSVYHKQIPPFLSAREPFSYYDFGNSRIRFNREPVVWEIPTGLKRVAALNSFPDGGTNCHLIIEEYVPDDQSYQSFLLPKELPAMARKVIRGWESGNETKEEKTEMFVTKWGEYREV